MTEPDLSPKYAENTPIHYFFHQYRTAENRHRSNAWHLHDFWQLEFILAGCGEFGTETETLTFHAGDTIIIPPGIRHVFRYPGKCCEWLSIKFAAETENRSGARMYPPDEILTPARAILLHLLNDGRLPERRDGLLTNAALAIFVHYHLRQDGDDRRPESSFLSRVSEYVLSREGHFISIDDVAAFLGYSPKYTSNRFRKEAGIPLKQFLDRQRYEYAVRRLSFTNDSIGTVAAALGFPDTYAFSRFFRHAAGKSPSQFRETHLHSM